MSPIGKARAVAAAAGYSGSTSTSEIQSAEGIFFSVLRGRWWLRTHGFTYTFQAVAPPLLCRRGALCLSSCAEL